MKSSNFLALPGHFAVKRPILTTIIVVCILVLCAGSLTRLKFENDISRSFSSGSVHSQNYTDFVSSLGFSPKQVIVLAETETAFSVQDYQTIQNLALEFELTSSVSSVFSIASARFPKKHPQYPNASLFTEAADLEEIQRRLLAFEETGLRSPISADGKSALFVISFDETATDEIFWFAVEELRTAATDYGGDTLNYNFTGPDLIGPELVEALQHDLVFNNIVGSVLAFALALLIFGNLNHVIIAVVPAVSAALVSLAIFSTLNIPINVLSTVIPILILVLALADSVHLTLHLKDSDAAQPVDQRIWNTLNLVGPACGLTAITTAVAFAAIGTSDNTQLRDLAIVGALAVLLGYVVVIVIFSLLSKLLADGKGAASKTRHIFAIPTGWPDWILGHSRLIYLVCTVLVAISAFGLTNIYPWYNLDKNLPTDSDVRATNQKISENFNGLYRVWSALDTSGANNLDTDEGWNRLVNLTDAVSAAAPDYPTLSLVSVSRWLGQPNVVPNQDALDDLPPELLRQLYAEDRNTAWVLTVTPEAMLDKNTLQIQSDIEAATLSAGGVRNIGLPIIMRHESVSVIKQLSVGLALACLVSVLIVAGYYRLPRLVLVLIIPNALPLAVAAASLVIIDAGALTPTAMLALTVAFGIAIDDSIHFINRYLAELKNGETIQPALKISIRETGRAMIVTTILISAGTMTTMISSFETVQLFGGMLILTFITALLADLFLLPCLLRTIGGRT